ncbi:MAG: aldehyde dehydrogenase family protein, partial [Acetobacteraceae bacterium]
MASASASILSAIRSRARPRSRGGTRDQAGKAAVAAALAAFPAWSRVPPRERGRALLRIADRMEAEAEAIARQIAAETGNALRTQARPEA